MYGINFELKENAKENSLSGLIDEELTKLGFRKVTNNFYVISEEDSKGMLFVFDVVERLGSHQEFNESVNKFTAFKVEDFTDLTNKFRKYTQY